MSKKKIENKLAVAKGTVMLGTVNTMSILGTMGEQVLREHGIQEIDPDKWYPHHLRAALQEVPFARYGDASLITFGYEMVSTKAMGDLWDAMLLDKGAINGDYEMVEMDQFLNIYMRTFTEMQALIIKGEYEGYGGRVKRIDTNQYEITLSTLAPIRHEAFHRTVLRSQIIKYGGKDWLPKFKLLSDKSCEGTDWSDCVYDMRLEPRSLNKTNRELLMEERLEARTDLMLKMFNDSESQKDMLEGLSRQLGKFVPPQIHNALISGNYDTKITTRRKKLTIFFSDIVNFTSTSEGLQPEDLTKYLNEYFSEMTKIAVDCGATIDKYIGDAMMVFFGDPETRGEKEDARSCVEMALKMQERIRQLQKKWRNQGFSNPFEVRMGLNTGYCNVGNFGSDQRLTYTIIGGEVNVAQRLEAGAKPGGILIPYETYAHSQDMIEVEEQETIQMKGINREIKVFSVQSRTRRQTIEKSINKHKKIDLSETTELDKMRKDILLLSNKSKGLENELSEIKLQLKQIFQVLNT